jgi:hypothetical protein
MAWIEFACCACCVLSLFGCRVAVPIYVWQPAAFHCPPNAKIAIAPIAGKSEIADRVEQALVMQRPVAREDLQLIASKQLVNHSPIRLASTASLQSDLTAVQAARQSTADLLLEGEILNANLVDPDNRASIAADTSSLNEQLLISWRVIDVATSKSVANHVVSIDTRRADKDYPEMLLTHPDPTERLIAASARDSWKSLAPSVARDKVDLMIPWLQVGAFQVRRGIVDCHNGRWDLAEQKFARASRWNPLSVAAHHNLAIAQAAREDFSAAKEQLSNVSWPLSTRLPAESRFWLDQRDRQYRAAHGLGKPEQGWLLPDPIESEVLSVEPTSIEKLPWWTAIPFAKPPGWTWRAWLTQPVVL